MRNFEAWQFADVVQHITQYRWLALKHDRDEEIDGGVVGEIRYWIDQYTEHCKALKLRASLACIKNRTNPNIRGAYGPITWGVLNQELGVLWDALEPEMSLRRFAHVAELKAIHVDEMLERERDKERLKNPWATVWKRFPSAKEDIEEAVYCYALDRDTACVFHLMRVAEYGLRALARRMKVTLPKRKPLEWGEWHEILREMSDVAGAVASSMKPGRQKDQLMSFYRGGIAQFYGFKDEFRNQVSHARTTYNEHQAANVLSRVREFMQKLAGKIDERGRRVKGTT